jgi:hypothetical protein
VWLSPQLTSPITITCERRARFTIALFDQRERESASTIPHDQ